MSDITCPTCGVALLEHPANRCLDEWIATAVMGLKIFDNPFVAPDYRGVILDGAPYYCPGGNGYYKSIPRYSSDISAAWEVVEKMQENGRYLGLAWDDDLHCWRVVFWWSSNPNDVDSMEEADTPMLAICRASLLAVLG